jgi:uncharacterized protein YndB with AHSA1/START domain
MPEVPDAVRRELVLPVPPERVWSALTQAPALGQWFGTRATVDLRVGGTISFVWDSTQGERFTNGGTIVALEPPRRFAFRWQPHVAPEHAARAAGITTLVEFTLEAHPDGTRLRLVESGFSQLPPDLRGTAMERNATGWESELAELAAYCARGAR